MSFILTVNTDIANLNDTIVFLWKQSEYSVLFLGTLTDMFNF